MQYTLEQLEKLSDAELSEAVFIKAYGEEATERIAKHARCFDINKWSFMGTLANKHKISAIYSSFTKEWCAFTEYDAATSVCHGNELRAKAIVFLLMGEE